MHTRRALIKRFALVAAGLEFAVACDRLPGQAPRLPRIGYVANESPPGAQTQALIAGLGDYGYTPGQNLQLDSRFPTEVSQAPDLIAELLRSGVDLLVTGGSGITAAAKQATSTVPIVGISISNPLGTGLVQTLARPGGNITGISNGGFFVGKWLELLQKIEPMLRRVGYLYNPDNPGHVFNLGQLNAAASALGLELVPAEDRGRADLDAAFDKAIGGGAEALICSGGAGSGSDAREAELALSHRLPSMGVQRSFPVAGGLMSYATDYSAMWRRGGYYIDRILKGVKPADLPVELPTTLELVINHTTASELGVTIPDEVAQQVTSWI